MLLKQYPRTGPCHTTVLIKAKQTWKQNIASLFYWEWWFSNPRQFICLLMQLLKYSVFPSAWALTTTHINYYKIVTFTEIFSFFEAWELVKNQTPEFSFLTCRNAFKWSLKTTTIIGIHCKNRNFNKKFCQINSQKNILYILFQRQFLCMKNYRRKTSNINWDTFYTILVRIKYVQQCHLNLIYRSKCYKPIL